MRVLVLALSAILTIAVSGAAQAFCGFYVAKADTSLFNRASQVVLVRDGDRTVLTMANDFEGDVKDFAMVIPVPTFIERGQINVADKALIDHLDAYTSPRLVEYFDPDPCVRYEMMPMMSGNLRMSAEDSNAMKERAKSQGVTIEASYTVGEYDILILSAKESNGLIDWLNDNGYKIPKGADKVIGSYLKQDMRFFVAKVNLEKQAKSGYSYLRPLQVAYESPKFMLPIRLGTLNAAGAQELFVYALTKTGRIETTNYRTVKLPSNTEVPQFVKAEFSDFYRSMFAKQVKTENDKAVFLEYAWDMAWCDPCAADPLSPDELRRLGVWWLPPPSKGMKPEIWRGNPQNVFVTRLHVRYDKEHFPEDLIFHETGDRQNFQGRYIVRNPWEGKASCDTTEYEAQLRERQEREAQQLANLTGWNIDDIREKMPLIAKYDRVDEKPWWASLWD